VDQAEDDPDTNVHLEDFDENAEQLPINEVRSYLKLVDGNVDMTQFSVRNVDTDVPTMDESQLYQTNRIVDKPIYLTDKTLDMMCYPEIFPKGIVGLYDERRFKISPPQYLHHIYNHVDPRVRRNQQFTFHELDR
jgi:hypothetical protein